MLHNYFGTQCLKTETTEKEIVDRIMKEYSGAERKTVEKDVANIIGKLRKIDAII